MGPQGFQDYHQVYLRTAISVDPKGWAHFEYVKLPDYRWGIFLAEPTRGSPHRLRPVQGPAGVAGSARRVPQPAAPPDRHAGRHRAGQRRAAAPARPALPEPLRPPQPVPGERRGRTPPLGDGLSAALLLRPRRPRRGGGAARAAQRQPATSRGCSRRSTRRSRRGSTCSRSRCSPIATASRSCCRCRRARSIRCRAPRASC